MFIQIVREHKGLLLASLFLFLLVCGVALAQGAEASEFLSLLDIINMSAISLIFFAGVVIAVFYLRAMRDASFSGKTLAVYIRDVNKLFDSRSDILVRKDLLIGGFTGMAALMLVMTSVCVGKSLIFYLTDYSWDPFFSDLDKQIHLGHYPFEVLIKIAEFFPLAPILNFTYLAWFIVMFLVCGACLFCDHDRVSRMHYLWSFSISWAVIGIGLAILLASGGPVYFQYFNPDLPNPYSALLEHLNKINETTFLNVSLAAPALLQITTDNKILGANGISAMPSMHVAIAWLMVLYAWKFRIFYGLIMLLYFFLILLGSVYLSWHYAIDGYVAVVVASLIWWTCGKWTRLVYS